MDEKDRKLAELEKKIEAMRTGQDIEFSEALRRRTLQDVINAGVVDNPTDENETTVIGAGGGSVMHAETYDKRVRVVIDGTPYYVGLYEV